MKGVKVPLGSTSANFALCLTTNCWLPTDSVAVLANPLLAATEKLITPLPVPLAEVNVTQEALVSAFQPQPAGAVTLTLPLLPAEP